MGLLGVLFRRGTPCRLRLLVLANICAFSYVVTMTLMTTAVGYFFVVPYLFKKDDPTMQAHRAVILYLFVNVCGNFIICIKTDTSDARAKTEVKVRSRGKGPHSDSKPRGGGKGPRMMQRSTDSSGASGIIDRSTSESSDPGMISRGRRPSLDTRETEDPREICLAKESNQTSGLSKSRRACAVERTGGGIIVSDARKTHLLAGGMDGDGDTPRSPGCMESEMDESISPSHADARSGCESLTDRRSHDTQETEPLSQMIEGTLIHSDKPFSDLSSTQASGQNKPSARNNISLSNTLKSVDIRVGEDSTYKTDPNPPHKNNLPYETKEKHHKPNSEHSSRGHDKDPSQQTKPTDAKEVVAEDSSETDNVHERSHFCVLCEKRILRRDHHCFFMCVCVGYHNHKHFIFFCLYMMVGTLYGVVVIAKFLNAVYGVKFWGPQTFFFLLVKVVDDIVRRGVFPAPMFGFLLYEMYACLVVGLVACGFFYWHLVISVAGQTTHDATTHRGVNYSQGARANIRDVFGPYWPLLFLLPLPLPQDHDGAHYHKPADTKTRDAGTKSGKLSEQRPSTAGGKEDLSQKVGENCRQRHEGQVSDRKTSANRAPGKNVKVRKRKR